MMNEKFQARLGSCVRKFILLSAMFVILTAGASGAVLADSKEPKKTPPSITEEFKVNEFLKVDDKKVDGKDVAGSGQRSFVPKSGEAEKTSPGEETGLIGFLVRAINLLVKIIGSLALIVFIIGAILTISSEGKEDRLEKGKTAMLYAVLGLIFTGLSFVLVTFVQSIFY